MIEKLTLFYFIIMILKAILSDHIISILNLEPQTLV